jgi:tetratricopeptide (TPR) repeat protein
VGFLLVLTALAGRAAAEDPRPEEDAVRRAGRSSAWVLAPQDARVTSTGTGWILDPKDRLLVTNQHVVGQAVNVTVMFPLYRRGQLVTSREEYLRHLRGGQFSYRGTVLATDARRDLALIQLESMPHLAALPLAEGGADKGDRVHFIGNPGDSKELWVADAGTVARAAPELIIEVNTGLQFKAQILTVETDTPIRPGYSGGPVVNDRGELVGVSTVLRRAGPQQAGCVDVTEIKAFLAAARRLVNPQTAADFKNVGSYHLDQKRYDRAVEAFAKAIRLAPSDPDVYVLRGSAYVHKGELGRALVDYDHAVELDAGYAWAYNNRGELYRLRRQEGKALLDFDKALECNPKYALAYFNRSLVLRARGDLKRARDDYQRALALAPSLADYQPDVPPDELARLADHLETYLPDDAGFVLAVNVRQLLAAPAFSKSYRARLERALKEQDRWQVLTAGLAFDPLQDLTHVLFTGAVADAKAAPAWRILVHGRFDPERFQTLAEDRFKPQEVPDGLGGRYRLYEVRAAGDKAPAYVALVNGTTVVLSPSRDEVLDALAKGAGWKRTALQQEAVRAGLERLDAGRSAWLVLAGGALLNNGVSAEKSFGLLRLVGGLSVTEDASVELRATIKDEKGARKAAQDLARDLPKLVDNATGTAGQRPELAPLLELAKALEVTAKDDTVVIKGQVSAAVIAEALRKEPGK